MTDVEAPATVEIYDAVFCTHLKEVCTECSYDGREDNDSFFGVDSIDREPIEAPAVTTNKDGVYQCKKHGSGGCPCFKWKKQIEHRVKAAKKAGKK